MSVLLAWQKSADQKIYAGDGCMTPEALELSRQYADAKCAGGRVHLKFAPMWKGK